MEFWLAMNQILTNRYRPYSNIALENRVWLSNGINSNDLE